MRCEYCGRILKDETVCPSCGAFVSNENKQANVYSNSNNSFNMLNNTSYSNKRKVVVVVLGLMFGYFGMHNFYLGYKKKGIVQLLLCVLGSFIFIGPIITSIWSFIEIICYIFDSSKTDASGKVLKW